MFVVAALYKFVTLTDLPTWQSRIREVCEQNGVAGTLLLAEEGINGTVAGSREGIDALLAFLHSQPEFADLEHKESLDETNPFFRLKIKLKKEIVTLGVPGINPNKQVGQYVNPEQWNELISADDVVIVDTRNDYEVAIGSFEGAMDPKTQSFRQFPDWVKANLDPSKHKKVAMFCTGGIRCEKSTAFMLEQGFEEVYHLKGGILKYLETVPKQQSKWQGDCFVFDNRVAVNHDLQRGDYEFCPACRGPISAEDKLSDKYEQDYCCPRCHDQLTEAQRARFRERQKQIQLARAKGKRHFGGEG
ncbi:UPF0176 protein [Permianibacter aggregans]|uniref:tRNA uridine(34) hydroxylase n=2 Tax=Permianibacter aggregans TaxID=1510150 RepID=A0A4R6V3D5_9GAMM|nr:UPF0176 protein [Permianibacter aggregans]